MSTKTFELKKYILDNPKTSSKQIAKKFNTTVNYIHKCRVEIKKGDMSIPRSDGSRGPTPVEIDVELMERKRQAALKEWEKRYNELLDKYDALEQRYDQALLLKEYTDIDIPTKIEINPQVTSQAVPIIQFSDWHVEERIDKRVTGGLNEYNPDIARRRVKKLTENTIKLINKERQDVKIKNLVICLGGDFINNYLHDHDVQENYLSPMEALLFSKELLKESLSTLAEYSGIKKITLPCARGNHGRVTKRMQSSNDHKLNYEFILYNMLKQELNDSLFEWYIPESELGYIEVYGKLIRTFHGHQVNYQGGVGDITIPVNKAIMKWDKTKKADWNLMHHFHRLWMPTSNCSLNGSLCGWNSYALSKGFQYEPPLQAFHLLDAKRGFTVRTPIQCE